MRNILTMSALVLFAACSDTDQPSQAEQGVPIECALAGAPDFTPVCLYRYIENDNQIMVSHPDGSKRLFGVLPGGAGVTSPGNSDQIIQGVMDGAWEVTIGKDRYRLPSKPAP